MDTNILRSTTEKVAGEIRRCEVCGVPATERTLIGLKNDRRRNGPRWCLSHHPSSMNATAVVAVVL